MNPKPKKVRTLSILGYNREIERLEDEIERLTADVKFWRDNCEEHARVRGQQTADLERLTAELEIKTHQHKRDLAEYNRVAERITKLEAENKEYETCCNKNAIYMRVQNGRIDTLAAKNKALREVYEAAKKAVETDAENLLEVKHLWDLEILLNKFDGEALE